jgi:hypothetical protein
MAQIKAVCTWLAERNHSTSVRLRVVDDPEATTETELAHEGMISLEITNPVPPIDFVRGQSYVISILPEGAH